MEIMTPDGNPPIHNNSKGTSALELEVNGVTIRITVNVRTLQRAYLILSRTCFDRTDISEQRKQELLQRAWNPIVKSKAWQTKCYSKS